MAFVNHELADLIDFKVYIPRLQDWFWREMGELFKYPSSDQGPAGGVLMGALLWGDDFIDRFCFFCLTSLRSKKNWEALAGRSRLVLFTDGPGFLRLFQVARDLEQAGMRCDVIVLPPEVMDFVNGNAGKAAQAELDALVEKKAPLAEIEAATVKVRVTGSPLNRYWLLGTIHNLSLQMCGRFGMGFHALHPDHLYSEAYFENMWRLAETHDGIVQTSVSADLAGVLTELEQYRQSDGSLTIPDLELGDMGWRHVHKQTLGNVMNGKNLNTELPDSHMLIWKGKNKLHMFCCHTNAVWMSPAVCARSPIRLYNAIDTEIPNFMVPPKGKAACNVALPEAHDGMTFIELSDDSKLHQTHRVNATDFAVRCWTTVLWREDHMPFFNLVNEVPIKEQAPGDYVADDVIKAEHAAICDLLLRAKEPLHAEWEKKKAERAALVEAEKKAAEDAVTEANDALAFADIPDFKEWTAEPDAQQAAD